MTTPFERLKNKYLHVKPKPKVKRIINPQRLPLPPAQLLDTQHIPNTPLKTLTQYKFGSHIPLTHGFLAAAQHAHKLKLNSMQIFIASSRRLNKPDTPFDTQNAQLCKLFIQQHDIDLWIHCPSDINLNVKCCPDTNHIRQALIQDITHATQLGAKGCVIHVGKLNNFILGPVTETTAIKQFKHNIETILQTIILQQPTQIPWILIETPAGQGSQTPVTIEKLGELFHSIHHHYRKYIGFCIDTCNIFASGQCKMTDTDEIDNFINTWNQHIGWEHVKLIHFNDSKLPFNSHKKQHAPIGQGRIGTKPLIYFRNFCILTGKPMVTE